MLVVATILSLLVVVGVVVLVRRDSLDWRRRHDLHERMILVEY